MMLVIPLLLQLLLGLLHEVQAISVPNTRDVFIASIFREVETTSEAAQQLKDPISSSTPTAVSPTTSIPRSFSVTTCTSTSCSAVPSPAVNVTTEASGAAVSPITTSTPQGLAPPMRTNAHRRAGVIMGALVGGIVVVTVVLVIIVAAHRTTLRCWGGSRQRSDESVNMVARDGQSEDLMKPTGAHSLHGDRSIRRSEHATTSKPSEHLLCQSSHSGQSSRQHVPLRSPSVRAQRRNSVNTTNDATPSTTSSRSRQGTFDPPPSSLQDQYQLSPHLPQPPAHAHITLHRRSPSLRGCIAHMDISDHGSANEISEATSSTFQIEAHQETQGTKHQSQNDSQPHSDPPPTYEDAVLSYRGRPHS
ncbi:hypothetical protein AMATHDRAFT_66889 [Amanita thiersii Skay4041]|uniref:Mid2 domain-containing protein n=1 Tax=Amanita thiersii Skay4041 TaxID=703135 RepID=A0A2A9NJA1_9AGAR|nr:hypothetical protein AMATHDRAFT_66889 [Amanita thiersii Skay4041]